MKVVYFIRHAKSDWANAALRDIERPLNERGRRDAPFMANLLQSKGVQPDLLVSSPANRAYTTATHFAQALGIQEEAIVTVDEMYEASVDTILEVVRSLPDTWNTALLFGHNPTFTDVVNQFKGQTVQHLPTCGIVKVEDETLHWQDFGFQNAHITAFYYPKQYFK